MDNHTQDFNLLSDKQLIPKQNGNNSVDYNLQFYNQMVNVKYYRKIIQKKMQELNQQRQKIYQKVVFYEKKTELDFRDYIRGQAPQRKKRNRRNADEIERQYDCPTCGKKYGSQGSMHQHIKLKHPSEYETKNRDDKDQ